jgi:hypothetical protein
MQPVPGAGDGVAMTRTLLCLAALVAAAGCTPASPDAATAGRSASSAAAQTVWRDFVTCARAHGQPKFPDPVLNDEGQADFPPVDGFNVKEALPAVADACGSILDRLPPQANPYHNGPLPPELLDRQRRWAECMREHGLPWFPDPDANGNIPAPAGGPNNLASPDAQLRETIRVARDACDPIRTGG